MAQKSETITLLDKLIIIQGIAGYFSLLISGIGQGILFTPVSRMYFLTPLVSMAFSIPWFLLYIITFFNQPFLPPRHFRICLLFIISSFVCSTILLEALIFMGTIPFNEKASFEVARVMMHTGWLCVYPLTRYYGKIVQFELTI